MEWISVISKGSGTKDRRRHEKSDTMYGLLTLIKLGAVTVLKEDVYLADLDRCSAVSEISYEDFLSEEEKERLRLILIPQSKNRVKLRLSMTRIILSSYLCCPPQKLRFCRDFYGKPSVMEPAGDLRFNLSHSGKYLILIADRKREVGIDIETDHSFKKRKYETIEALYSPEEFTYYQGLSPQEQYQMFCRTWVMKEAVTKAFSLGLTADLEKISLPLGGDIHSAILSLDFYGTVLKIQWITREGIQIAIAYREEEI